MNTYRLTFDAYNSSHPEFGEPRLTVVKQGYNPRDALARVSTLSADGHWYPEWKLVRSDKVA